MCIPGLDPLTLLGVIGGLGSAAAGATAAFAKPPEPVIPAAPAPTLQDSGTDIRIGDQTTDQRAAGAGTKFIPTTLTRASGKSLGGLGRSGLAL